MTLKQRILDFGMPVTSWIVAAFIAGMITGAAASVAGFMLAAHLEERDRACAREGGRLVVDQQGVLGGQRGETWCVTGGASVVDRSMGLVNQ